MGGIVIWTMVIKGAHDWDGIVQEPVGPTVRATLPFPDAHIDDNTPHGATSHEQSAMS